MSRVVSTCVTRCWQRARLQELHLFAASGVASCTVEPDGKPGEELFGVVVVVEVRARFERPCQPRRELSCCAVRHRPRRGDRLPHAETPEPAVVVKKGVRMPTNADWPGANHSPPSPLDAAASPRRLPLRWGMVGTLLLVLVAALAAAISPARQEADADAKFCNAAVPKSLHAILVNVSTRFSPEQALRLRQKATLLIDAAGPGERVDIYALDGDLLRAGAAMASACRPEPRMFWLPPTESDMNEYRFMLNRRSTRCWKPPTHPPVWPPRRSWKCCAGSAFAHSGLCRPIGPSRSCLLRIWCSGRHCSITGARTTTKPFSRRIRPP